MQNRKQKLSFLITNDGFPISKLKGLVFFIVFLAILGFSFRSLITNISTNLVDSNDYPLVVWIFSQNLKNIQSLNWPGFFDTNILYPHKNTLFLAENLIVPSLMALPFFVTTNNYILSFNTVFLLTLIFDYLALYLFWKLLTKNETLAFVGSILVVFSPFFYSELAHYQLLVYWPSILALYYLFKNEVESKLRNSLFIGFLVTVQFLSCAYITIFLLSSISIYFVLKVIFSKKRTNHSLNLLIILTFFLFTGSVFIKGHLDVRKEFHIVRSYGESVQYSAHITDYLFTNQRNTLLSNFSPIKRWNSINNHPGPAFPGFTVVLCIIFLAIKTIYKDRIIKFKFKDMDIFFFLLCIVGIYFSLGPRLGFDGYFSRIPLFPYHLLVKYVPLFNSIRAPSRWSFLFYFGLTYFAIKFLKSIKLSKIVYSLLFAGIILEYVPVTLTSSTQDYLLPKDEILKQICAKKQKVVLEIPLTHLDASGGIIQGLQYITARQLASSYHNCDLVNGYTSYDPPELFILKDILYQYIYDLDTDGFISSIIEAKADIFSINTKYLPLELNDYTEYFFYKLDQRSDVNKLTEGLYLIK